MRKSLKWAALAALVTAAAACGKAGDGDAVGAAQGLLAAAQAGDAKAFEAHLDRPALRSDLKVQMAGVAKTSGLDLGGPSDLALDQMIDPAAVHLVQAGGGAPLSGPPTLEQVKLLIRRLDGHRACLHDLSPQQTCIMTFAKEPTGWRLIGMLAGGLTVAVPPEPAKK